MSISVVNFDPTHIPGIAEVWNSENAGTGNIWAKYANSKFFENPDAIANPTMGVGDVLVQDGVVLGSKLWMPQEMHLLGKSVVVPFSCDTIVSKEFRQYSLKLILAYFQRFCDPLVVSTSAGPHHARIWHARRGADVPGGENRILLALRPGKLIQMETRDSRAKLLGPLIRLPGHIWWRKKFGMRWKYMAAKTSVQEVAPESEEIQSLVDKYRADYAITSQRSRDQLKWRFQNKGVTFVLVSDRGGNPIGYAAYRPNPSAHYRAQILDLFGSNDDRELQLKIIGALAGYLADNGFLGIDACGFSLRWQKSFVDLGSRVASAPSPFVFRSTSISESKLSEIQDRWHLTLADGDASLFGT